MWRSLSSFGYAPAVWTRHGPPNLPKHVRRSHRPCRACGLVILVLWAHANTVSGINFARDLPALGVWGPAAIVGSRLAASLCGVVPSSPILLAAGAAEGVFLGSLYVLIGAVLGALIGFLIGRHFGCDFVERRGWIDTAARPRLGRWLLDEKTPQAQLMAAVFLCRLIPGLNFDVLSYVVGVTPLKAWRFCLASFAGLLPYTVLLAPAGRQLVTLGSGALTAILFGIALLTVVPLVLRKRGAGAAFGP